MPLKEGAVHIFVGKFNGGIRLPSYNYF